MSRLPSTDVKQGVDEKAKMVDNSSVQPSSSTCRNASNCERLIRDSHV